MGGSIFGRFFKVATFGESHGAGLGCVIDACPANLNLSENDIQKDLDRRKPGQSSISTPRKEGDVCKILSGVLNGKTLGTPIAILIENTNQRSSDDSEIEKLWRPSHADYTYDAKYGIRDARGGGRSSARETAAQISQILRYSQSLHSLGIFISSRASLIYSQAVLKSSISTDGFVIIPQGVILPS